MLLPAYFDAFNGHATFARPALFNLLFLIGHFISFQFSKAACRHLGMQLAPTGGGLGG